MTFKCCICGTAYDNEAAAVKCVNRCGRAMHKKGVFQTKESSYGGETTEIEASYQIENENFSNWCRAALDTLEGKIPNGVHRSLVKQMNDWENLTLLKRTQLYDMILLYMSLTKEEANEI